MAGGAVVKSSADAHRASEYEGKFNFYVFMVVMVAASGGLLFGYDNGITGGVSTMPDFQKKFFPSVYEAEQEGKTDTGNAYCVYDDAGLQIFTSSLFLAGLVISIPASFVTSKYGRKPSMTAAGACFLIGAGLNAGAQDLAMLIIGRVFLGFGVGFANQVVPLYLSEQAPCHLRGALNQMFQLLVTIGILVAQLINYGTQDMEHGWRLSLGLAAVPACIMFLGGLLLPESPNSLVERGHVEKGRKVLARLRGVDNVDAEFEDIQAAVDVAKSVSVGQSWRAQFRKPYLPIFIVTVCIAALQQLTGINAIMFYSPVIFNSLGSGKRAALMNTCIIGAVNIASTFLSIFTVDRFGRKKLFLVGGIQMAIMLAITSIVLGVMFGKYVELPSGAAAGVLVVICLFVMAFAYSWGPLGWLVPSEIQTLETRAAGMGSAVCANFLFSFIIGQAFLSMLCAMRWGVFLFFGGWVVIMTLFVMFLVPETKGVPVERVPLLFAKHKVWRKFMGPAAVGVIEQRDIDRADAQAARKAANGMNGGLKSFNGNVKEVTATTVGVNGNANGNAANGF